MRPARNGRMFSIQDIMSIASEHPGFFDVQTRSNRMGHSVERGKLLT
jgi:hypothetical protein